MAKLRRIKGGMDASQYKNYVLVLLFVKYVSDKYAGDEDALIEVPEGGSFADLVALKGDKEIGDKINKIIGRLAEANDLKGIIDVADFNNIALVSLFLKAVAICSTQRLKSRSYNWFCILFSIAQFLRKFNFY